MKENLKQKQEKAARVIAALKKAYPDARCALDYRDAWELLVATVLSAQCTDKRVNQVTPALFKRFPSMSGMAEAELKEIEELIHSAGFYKNKANNIREAARMILKDFGGIVPRTLEELTRVPGVGRKTANVVLGNYYDVPGMPVDTHMLRVNRRLGFTVSDDAVKVEQELMKLVPRDEWVMYSHYIISHGRERCFARKPDCSNCEIQDICPKIGAALYKDR